MLYDPYEWSNYGYLCKHIISRDNKSSECFANKKHIVNNYFTYHAFILVNFTHLSCMPSSEEINNDISSDIKSIKYVFLCNRFEYEFVDNITVVRLDFCKSMLEEEELSISLCLLCCKCYCSRLPHKLPAYCAVALTAPVILYKIYYSFVELGQKNVRN